MVDEARKQGREWLEMDWEEQDLRSCLWPVERKMMKWVGCRVVVGVVVRRWRKNRGDAVQRTCAWAS